MPQKHGACLLQFYYTITTSCEEEVYPEAGSLPDKTPPSAAFSATQGVGFDNDGKLSPFPTGHQVPQTLVGISEMGILHRI